MQNYKRRNLCFIIAVVLLSIRSAFSSEDFSLNLEPIVVTQARLSAPYSIGADFLERLKVLSPLEALGSLPLDLQSRNLKSAIQTDFSLRGSSFQGVLILINGQRINDPQTAHHNSDIPLTCEDIERITVLQSVNSSIFGPDAIGGAINITLKKPETKKRVLEISFGEYQTISGFFSASDKINNLGIRLSLENQESEGFRDDTDFKKFTAALSSVLDLPYGEFDCVLGYLEKEFGAYDFYTPASGYLSKEWTKTYLLNSGFDLNKEGFIIKPNFLWRRHYDKFMLDKTQIRTRYLNHHRTDIYTPNIYLGRETSFFGKVGLGLEYGQEMIESTNLGQHKRRHSSIFIDDSKDLSDKISLGLSLRRDVFESFGQTYSGSINFRYKVTAERSFYYGFSRNIRIPSFTELYYDDPTTLGNAGLGEEKAWNYQAGFDYKKDSLSWGITLFSRRENDIIDWVKRDPGQAKWQVENIGSARVLGFENYWKINLSDYLSLNSNYIYIDKRIQEDSLLYKYGPNFSNHIVNIIFNFALPFGTQVIKLTYKKKPDRDGWVLLDASFSRSLNKNTKFFVEITNLLNMEYQEIEGIPQAPRWARAGLRLEW